MEIRFRIPEIFLGALLTIAVFAMGTVVSSTMFPNQQQTVESQGPLPRLREQSQPIQPQTKYSQQPTGTDQRGTKSQPLIVDVVPPKKDAAEIAADRRERDQKAAVDGRLGFYTGLLALFTFFLFATSAAQVILFLVQLRLIRESLTDAKIAADAAKEAADATKDSVVAMRDTAQRQLRAYVAITPSRISQIGPDKKLAFTFMQLNGGQTPAYAANHSGVILLLDHPIPEDFPFPEIPKERPSRSTLPPRIPFLGNILATQNFTQAEWIEIFQGVPAGGKRLYFFGRLDYRDAFGHERWNTFCFSFPGWHEAVLLAQQGNWNAIDVASQTAGFQFEAASQHNVTDEG